MNITLRLYERDLLDMAIWRNELTDKFCQVSYVTKLAKRCVGSTGRLETTSLLYEKPALMIVRSWDSKKHTDDIFSAEDQMSVSLQNSRGH